jgi:hypothetical protein
VQGLAEVQGYLGQRDTAVAEYSKWLDAHGTSAHGSG